MTSHSIQSDVKATSISYDRKVNRQLYSCHICLIELSNSKNYNSHLNSREHQIKQCIQEVLQSISSEFRSAYKSILTPEFFNKKIFNRKLKFDEEIRSSEQIFLGLNSIIEFQFENVNDPTQYICETCRCKCSSTSSILSHLLSIEHQRTFLNVHHPEISSNIFSSSTIRSEQQRLIENFARQISSHYDRHDQIQFHLQLNRFLGPKSIVLSLTFRSSSTPIVHIASKAFEDYDYPYADKLIKENGETRSFHSDSLQQRGLLPEDLLFPFNRQYWHENYADLLQSRPIDPHFLTYDELSVESQRIPSCPPPIVEQTNENVSILENDQTFRRNSIPTSTRRVVLDSSRSLNGSKGLIITTTNHSSPTDSDRFKWTNEHHGKTPILNEHSARAILAASGLLRSDDEDEDDDDEDTKPKRFNSSSDQSLSPALAKRMLDAVLTGDLNVVHIQPYFSTFVNLIQTGQVELERHQAERLLHKLLVNPSTSPESNSSKRIRSDNNTSQSQNERRVLSSSSSSTMTRRVHLINESNSNQAERSFQFSKNFQRQN